VFNKRKILRKKKKYQLAVSRKNNSRERYQGNEIQEGSGKLISLRFILTQVQGWNFLFKEAEKTTGSNLLQITDEEDGVEKEICLNQVLEIIPKKFSSSMMTMKFSIRKISFFKFSKKETDFFKGIVIWLAIYY
jgi:hypothetical protein